MQYKNIRKEKNMVGVRKYHGLVNSAWFSPIVGVVVFLGLLVSSSVFATDLLKGAMPTIKENFGTDSTVVRIIYLADIITSIFIYFKTRDFKIAGSVLLTLIYLTYTLNNIVFKGM